MERRTWSARSERAWACVGRPRCATCSRSRWLLRQRSRRRARVGSWQAPHRRMTHRVATTDDVEVNTYLEIAEAQTAQNEAATVQKLEGSQQPVDRDAVVVIDFGS